MLKCGWMLDLPFISRLKMNESWTEGIFPSVRIILLSLYGKEQWSPFRSDTRSNFWLLTYKGRWSKLRVPLLTGCKTPAINCSDLTWSAAVIWFNLKCCSGSVELDMLISCQRGQQLLSKAQSGCDSWNSNLLCYWSNPLHECQDTPRIFCENHFISAEVTF